MAKKRQVHRHQEERAVRVALQDKAERERLTKRLLGLLKELDETRIEAANVAAKYRDKMKETKKEVDGTAADLEVGVETMRMVEITRNFNPSKDAPIGRLTVKDVENGTVYEDRPMTEEDAQLPISDLPNAEDGGEPGDDEQ